MIDPARSSRVVGADRDSPDVQRLLARVLRVARYDDGSGVVGVGRGLADTCALGDDARVDGGACVDRDRCDGPGDDVIMVSLVRVTVSMSPRK